MATALDVIKSAGLLVVVAVVGGDPSLVKLLMIISGVIVLVRELRRKG